MMRNVPTADASFAACRARSRFGIAIAAIIRMRGIIAIPMYPSTKPAVAIPAPPILPADLRISESAMWPKMMAAIDPRKKNPKIPQTRLAMAFPLVGGFPTTACAPAIDGFDTVAPETIPAGRSAASGSPQPAQYFAWSGFAVPQRGQNIVSPPYLGGI